MDMGIGFSEIVLIVLLILVFFGSKELPQFLREGARFVAKVRRYGDKVRQELNEITADVGATPRFPVDDTVVTKKKEIRARNLRLRKELSPGERSEKSAAICRYLMDSPLFRNAGAIMAYVDMGTEVETRAAVQEMLRMGKRVVIPYSKPAGRNLGLGEITDIDKDIIVGEGNAPEPRIELRDRFYRSDLQLIICPGVGFDVYGGRLGRGRAYYDNFLRELKNRVPIVGLAFDCQVLNEHLPFSYSDITMDQIITESGFKLPVGNSGDAGSVSASTTLAG
jgi:5-formyltetrahydrofolate cyclo-ligase